jgi:tetratricopeptide (TPR) repeat protein
VKDHGVIFTVTLPPQRDPKPAAPSAPKPATEWERMRKQLRGEKPEASTALPKQTEPSVADLVLEALAKNGHHFSKLGDKESLTVSIVFRPEAHRNPGRMPAYHAALENPFVSEAELAAFAEAAVLQEGIGEAPGGPGKGSGPQDPKNLPPGPPGTTPADKGSSALLRESAARALAEASSPRDYELLGDLHRKQGQNQEALRAYQKAADKNPDAQHAAAMYLKMAQLYLTVEHDEAQARTAMDRAREILASLAVISKEPAKPNERGSSLPSRLIISVPKRLLDMVGSGKMSVADFKKAAIVEHLSFDGANKPEASDPKRKAGH